MPIELLEIYIPFLIGYEGTLAELKRKPPANATKGGDPLTKRYGITWDLFSKTGDIHGKPEVYESFLTIKIEDVIKIVNHYWMVVNNDKADTPIGIKLALIDFCLSRKIVINDGKPVFKDNEVTSVIKKCYESINDLEPSSNEYYQALLQKIMLFRRKIMKDYIDVADKQYDNNDIAKVTQLEQLIINHNLI